MRKFLFLFVVFLLSITNVFAQTRTITGSVTDFSSKPVPNASISVKGTTIGTITNASGEFSINVPNNRKTLIVTSIGHNTIEVNILDETSVIPIVLSSDEVALDEVLVVAYGKASRRSLVGAVSQVNAEDIEKRAITTVTGVLEGSSSGVMVNNTYGQPGSSPDVRIRGFTSVNGSNSPLYVLDGVIFSGNISDINPNDVESVSVLKDASAASLYGNRAANGVIIITTKKAKGVKPILGANINQGFYTRGIKEYERLGANEWMESMWLGYRNNLLSTNPTTYSTEALANAKASQSVITDNIVYNIYNKANDALFDANGKLVSDAKILDGYLDDLDWYSPIIQLGHRQDYNINGGNATEKSNLYFSTGYLDEKGYMKRSRFQRFTGRLNGDITPVKWLKAGVVLAGSSQINNNYSDGNSSFVNPIFYARNISPVYPLHLHDATTGDYILDGNGDRIYDDGSTYSGPQYIARHAIWENELNIDRGFRNTMQGQAYADIYFLKDFTFTIRGDLSLRNSEDQSYDNAIIGDGQGNHGRASRTLYRYKTYTFQQQLNWRRSFGEHNVEVLIGHENFSDYYSYLYGYKTTETFTGQTDLINFTDITSLTDYQNFYTTESYLSRARYNFSRKYFLEASFRRDGSSRFYKDNRWGNFWGVGGSWLVSEENFIKNIPQINSLKFRASFGQVGNDQSAGRYAWMALYSMNQNSNIAALYKSQNEARDISWETTESWGAALEGTLFKRLNFVAEYFDKRSVDLLFDVNLPLSAGATSTSSAEAVITKNLGTSSNRGWEFTVDGDVVRKSELRINLGANITFLKNKILKLPEENRENGIISGTKRYLEGHGIYDYWLYQYAGVDQMNGNALYLPDNTVYNGGDPNVTDKTPIPTEHVVLIGDKYYTTNPTYALRNWSGSSLPRYFGGFTLNVDWKNFSLSGIFSYAVGSKIIDYNYQSLMSMSGVPSSLHKDILKGWNGVPSGMTETSANRIDPNGIPAIDFYRSQYSNQTSSRFLQNGTYGVVKNITLGYKLPQNLLQKITVSNCTVKLAIENLVTLTKLQGMDPQQSFSGTNYNYFMTPRVLSLGLNIGL
ncbi:MAG: SusC/RagA family TonB-linked outer membrane protein [Niabella sp.]